MTEEIGHHNFIYLLKQWAKPLGITIPEAAWDLGYNVMHGERELCHITQRIREDQVSLYFRKGESTHPIEHGKHDQAMMDEIKEWCTGLLETT